MQNRHWLIKPRKVKIIHTNIFKNPIDLQVKWLDPVYEPILLYGTQIWDYEKYTIIL